MKELGMFDRRDVRDSREDTEMEFDASNSAPLELVTPMLRFAEAEPCREQFVAAPTVAAPPEHLLRCAGGDVDVAEYLRSGHLMARSIYELIRSHTISVKEQARVLDFGCGPGRLTTWLRSRFVRWELHGTDTHAESVAWAQSNLQDVAQFTCNVGVPPLRYWDGSFDLVIALFVFTQPDDESQSEWFEELVRVTRPCGHLIVSTPEHHERGSVAAISSARTPGMKLSDWSSFYRTNHLATDFIRQAWGKFARIEQIVPRWFNRDQALVICRRL